MKLDVESIVRDFWKLQPLGTTQEEASRWLEHALTAYADSKLEEAAKLLESDCSEVDYCDPGKCGYAQDVRTLKSTPVSDASGPGGAKR